MLLALGLPPLTANVTNTVSLVLTGAGSTIGSRPELAGQGPRVQRFGLVTAVGGATGAALLLLSPARDFELVVPVLVAGAAVLLLAVLGMMVDEALARVNALKNAVNGLANLVAALGFMLFAPVRWLFVLPLAAGSAIGGWAWPSSWAGRLTGNEPRAGRR